MTTRRFLPRPSALAALVLALGLPACGGGSSSTTTNPVATFTPDTPTPGPATIAMLAGSHSGVTFTVRVTVTGIDHLFGTAFRVSYDPDALFFNGMDSSTSVLLQGVTAADTFFQANQTANVGEIVVTATRLNPEVAGTIDVAATADLVSLNFSARKRIAAGDASGVLDFIAPREVQVCDTSVSPPACTAAAVTWSGGDAQAQ